MKSKAKVLIKDEEIHTNITSVSIIMIIILIIVSFYIYLSFISVQWYYRYPIALWVGVVLGYMSTYPKLFQEILYSEQHLAIISKQTMINSALFLLIYFAICQSF